MEAEAEALNMKWMEAEAEAEAVKKILEAEAEGIQIYRFHRFHYSSIWGKIFFILRKSLEIKLDLKPIWTSTKWKRPYRKRVDFKSVKAEAD